MTITPVDLDAYEEPLRKQVKPNGSAYTIVADEQAFREREAIEHAKKAFPFKTFADVDIKTAHKPWLHKGVMARGEVSSWIGAPGAAKSALLTDIGLHLAAGLDWRGKPNADPCGVVYFALERAGLLERRLAAYQVRDKIPDNIPFVFSNVMIDIGDQKSVEKIVATVKTVEHQFRCSVGLIIVDTYNKGIAAGGRDEDKAKDQNAVNANMRRILGQANVHIAGVGHMGKDESRGERGSNARLADVDLLVKVSGDPIRTVEIEKANDQQEGVLTTFSLEVVEISHDKDADPVRTAIVCQDAGLSAPRRRQVTGQKKIALELLERALLDAGEIPPASNQIPPSTRTVSVSMWRTYCYRGMISESDTPDSKRKAFVRCSKQLQGIGLIGVWNDHVWLPDMPDIARTC